MTAPSATGMTNRSLVENPDPSRCSFFLSGHKARFCRSLVARGQRFCGNHLHLGDPGAAIAAPQRVPCPLDPSHTVLASELEIHVSKRCPALQEALRERAQPHFLEDANAGSDAEPELPPPPPLPRQHQRQQQPSAPAAQPPQAGEEETAAAPSTCAGGPGTPAVPAVAAAAPPPPPWDAAAAAAGGDCGGPGAAAAAAVGGPGSSAAASAEAATPAAAAAAAAAGRVAALNPFQRGRAAQRAALARGLGEAAFRQLLARLNAAHAAACRPSPSPEASAPCAAPSTAAAPSCSWPPLSVLRPPECEAMLSAPSQLRPCDLKHGLQQASIVGNMQRVGLISPGPKGGAGVAVVELGAGKGYLGATLAECCGVERLVATDIKAGLKLKADRRVRHITFGRYRVDLKDYVPSATPELASAPPGSPWVAVAKHLCGAATDFGLRACVLRDHHRPPLPTRGSANATAEAVPAEAPAEAPGGAAAAATTAPACDAAAATTAIASGGGGGGSEGARLKRASGEADIAAAATAAVPPGEGMAAAQEAAQDAAAAGRKKRRRGGSAAAGAEQGADLPQREEQQQQEQQQAEGKGKTGSRRTEEPRVGGTSGAATADAGPAAGVGAGSGAVLRGLAIAPCCHHRCGWRAYTGKPLFRRLGLSATDFELISWMTGWALCGHDTPAGAPGTGSGGGGGSDDEGDGAQQEDDDGGCCRPDGAEGEEQEQENGGSAAGDGNTGGWCPDPLPPTPAAATDAADVAEAGAAPPLPPPFDPVFRLPRWQRMAVGAQCKQLIDAGRLDWLRRRFRSAELVSYIGPEVTGENRLLLAVGPREGTDAATEEEQAKWTVAAAAVGEEGGGGREA